MKRMYSLDLLKLLLAYVVALGHIGVFIQPESEVAVQVFFMISGFFLAKKFCAKRGEDYDQLAYTLDHAKSVYPHYLFSLIAVFAYLTTRALVYLVKDPSIEQVHSIYLSIYNQIPDLVLLQSASHYHDSMNYPLWQLSALLIAGYFVYGLLRWNEKLSLKMIFPAAILMIQSVLNLRMDLWANYGPFYLPLIRAFSPMCIGVFTYYFFCSKYYHSVRKYNVLFNLAGFYAMLTLFTVGTHDYVFLITTPILVLCCYDPASWLNKAFNRRIFRKAGFFSYAIYLNHALIQRFTYARVLPRMENSGFTLAPWHEAIIYLLLVTVYSVVTVAVVERITNYCKMKKAVAT